MITMLNWLGKETLNIFQQFGAIVLLLVSTVKQFSKINLHETAYH